MLALLMTTGAWLGWLAVTAVLMFVAGAVAGVSGLLYAMTLDPVDHVENEAWQGASADQARD